MDFDWGQAALASFFVLLLAGVLYSTWRSMQVDDRRWRRQRVREGFAVSARKPVRREERRFRRQFPELQPFFHPEKAILFVREQRRFKPKDAARARKRWMPAGFNTWSLVTLNPGERVPRLELRSWRNTLLASFTYEATGDGAILRIGEGEMVVVDDKDNPHARYRHPQRGFRWTAQRGWRVGTAARPREHLERDTVDHGYGDDAAGSARAAAGTAAAAALVGAGGSFDGGGSSDSWDSAGGEGDASDSWESAADSDDSGADDTSTD